MASGPLALLGETLQRGSADYANRQLQQEDEARRRQQQLQDTASERQFITGRDTAHHDWQTQDEQNRMQMGILSALVNEHLLAPGDMGNPDAVKNAWEAARAKGLLQEYKNLTDLGLLNMNDVGDAGKVAAARTQYAEMNLGATTASANLPANADKRQTELLKQAQAITQQLDDTQKRIRALPQTAPAVTNKDIRNYADVLAVKAGKDVGKAKDFEAQAKTELEAEAQAEWFQSQKSLQDLRLEQEGLQFQLGQVNNQYGLILRETKSLGQQPAALRDPAQTSPPSGAPSNAAASKYEQFKQEHGIGAAAAPGQPTPAPGQPSPALGGPPSYPGAGAVSFLLGDTGARQLGGAASTVSNAVNALQQGAGTVGAGVTAAAPALGSALQSTGRAIGNTLQSAVRPFLGGAPSDANTSTAPVTAVDTNISYLQQQIAKVQQQPASPVRNEQLMGLQSALARLVNMKATADNATQGTPAVLPTAGASTTSAYTPAAPNPVNWWAQNQAPQTATV